MSLLEQCKSWNDSEEYEKVVDTIEILPESAGSPELDMELARAYNNIGREGDTAYFAQAAGLLEPYEEYFRGNHRFYYRLAYAYFFLGKEGQALHYFKEALDARPGDADTEDMINACINHLSYPVFEEDFSKKTADMWKLFLSEACDIQAGLRKKDINAAKKISDIISNVYPGVSVRLTAGVSRPVLEISAGSEKLNVFMLEYIRENAPKEAWDIFDIRVGLSPSEAGGGAVIIGDEVYDISNLRFYVSGDREIAVYDALESEADDLAEILEELFIQTFGEIDLMANDFQVYMVNDYDFALPENHFWKEADTEFNKDNFLKLSVDYTGLREACRNKGFRLEVSPEDYLLMYSGYQLQPAGEGEPREDIYIGTSCLPALISEYIASGIFDKAGIADKLHESGIAAGYFFFSAQIESRRDDRLEYEFNIAELRDELANHIKKELKKFGKSSDIVFLEGATGLYYGYLDFLCFGSIEEILESARVFFEDKKLKFAAFKTFRKISRTITLLSEE